MGKGLNFSDIASSVGVSSTTIKSWLSVLEASFVVYVLRPYFNNLGKRLVKAPRVYFTETGLAAYLNGIRSPEQAAMHPNLGGLFENSEGGAPTCPFLPRLSKSPPESIRLAGLLPDSNVIHRVEIAESPVKRAFRGVRPPPVPPTLIDPNHPDSNRP